jgi:RNase H-fold protein (predicted Holliday junction resolvase)
LNQVKLAVVELLTGNNSSIERVSIECQKTKTKVITWPITKDTDSPANQNSNQIHNLAREKIYERIAIGFGFTSDSKDRIKTDSKGFADHLMGNERFLI